MTRDTLIDISATNITRVTESLLQLLEELARPFKTISDHPPHIFSSELFILHLLSDCCTAHWDSVNEDDGGSSGRSQEQSCGHSDERGENGSSGLRVRSKLPTTIDDNLASRILAAMRIFLAPFAEDFVLPSSGMLHDGPPASVFGELSNSVREDFFNGGTREEAEMLQAKAEIAGIHIRTIVEFTSASNWSYVINFVTNELRGPHANSSVIANGPQHLQLTEEDNVFLVSFRFIAMLWVDARKLGTVIQEVCGNFLHLRRPFKHTVAIVLPLLIAKWILQNPKDFIALHLQQRRLDGGADTLFDMTTTNTTTDHVRLRPVIQPFQMTLLLLLPDVWNVATGIREAKSSSMSKKISYLDGLRKAVRNRNETSAFCLVALLRIARLFSLDSDSTILSYALDVEDEVREAIFRTSAGGNDSTLFDPGLLTAAFVAIVHLDPDHSVDNFTPLCLAQNSPQAFKIAYVSACTHFAQQTDLSIYQPFFERLSSFIRAHLKVSFYSSSRRN